MTGPVWLIPVPCLSLFPRWSSSHKGWCLVSTQSSQTLFPLLKLSAKLTSRPSFRPPWAKLLWLPHYTRPLYCTLLLPSVCLLHSLQSNIHLHNCYWLVFYLYCNPLDVTSSFWSFSSCWYIVATYYLLMREYLKFKSLFNWPTILYILSQSILKWHCLHWNFVG